MITIFTLTPAQKAIAAVSPSLMQFCIMANIPYPTDEDSRHQLERAYRRANLANYLEQQAAEAA